MTAWSIGQLVAPGDATGLPWWPVLHAGDPSEGPWAWHPHPDVWLLVAVLALGYVGLIRWLGPRLAEPGERPVTLRQAVLYYLGVALVWVAADWPVHDLSEGYLYSVHMVQHMVFSLVAPPLLLLGTPGWLVRAALRPRRLLRAARWVTRPVPALLIFNGVVVATHLPVVVDLTLRSEPAHFAAHAVLVASALLMWWPVASPVPDLLPRLPYAGQMVYLFVQSLVPTVPASFLTFSPTAIYPFYEAVPRLWGISAVEDQRVAGLIMKLGGGLLLWGIIAALFFKWYAQEEASGRDGLTWEAVEHELQQMGLTKR